MTGASASWAAAGEAQRERAQELEGVGAAARPDARLEFTEFFQQVLPLQPCLLLGAPWRERARPAERLERRLEALAPAARRERALTEAGRGAAQLRIQCPARALQFPRRQLQQSQQLAQRETRNAALLDEQRKGGALRGARALPLRRGEPRAHRFDVERLTAQECEAAQRLRRQGLLGERRAALEADQGAIRRLRAQAVRRIERRAHQARQALARAARPGQHHQQARIRLRLEAPVTPGRDGLELRLRIGRPHELQGGERSGRSPCGGAARQRREARGDGLEAGEQHRGERERLPRRHARGELAHPGRVQFPAARAEAPLGLRAAAPPRFPREPR